MDGPRQELMCVCVMRYSATTATMNADNDDDFLHQGSLAREHTRMGACAGHKCGIKSLQQHKQIKSYDR